MKKILNSILSFLCLTLLCSNILFGQCTNTTNNGVDLELVSVSPLDLTIEVGKCTFLELVINHNRNTSDFIPTGDARFNLSLPSYLNFKSPLNFVSDPNIFGVTTSNPTSILFRNNGGNFTAGVGAIILVEVCGVSPANPTIADISFNGSIGPTSQCGDINGTNQFASAAIAVTVVQPVKLTSFNANQIENEVLLDWTSSLETNFSHFEVERSADAINFDFIGRVDGNNYEKAYTHLDKKPSTGLNYYRLKMVDLDKTFVYSDVKVVDISGKFADVSVFPNPFANGFTVSGLVGQSTVRVVDSKGSIIYNTKTQDKNLRIDLLSFPSGLYNVVIQSNSKIMSQNLIKID